MDDHNAFYFNGISITILEVEQKLTALPAQSIHENTISLEHIESSIDDSQIKVSRSKDNYLMIEFILNAHKSYDLKNAPLFLQQKSESEHLISMLLGKIEGDNIRFYHGSYFNHELNTRTGFEHVVNRISDAKHNNQPFTSSDIKNPNDFDQNMLLLQNVMN